VATLSQISTRTGRGPRISDRLTQEDCRVEIEAWDCGFFGCHWSYSTSDCDVGNALVEYDQWHPQHAFPATNFDSAILLSQVIGGDAFRLRRGCVGPREEDSARNNVFIV